MNVTTYHRRKTLFGNELTAKLYYAVKDFIFEHQLYTPYKIEDNGDIASLTLFNCFRYSKVKATGKIKVEYYCFKKQQWVTEIIRKKVTRYFSRCPNISFFHPSKHFLKNAQREMVAYVINYIKTCYPQYRKADSIQEVIIKIFSKNQPVFLNTLNHEKRIVKWLWAEFLDRAVVSMTLRIEGYRNANLSHYLRYQSHLQPLLRIAEETPNLMPLLVYVKEKYWYYPDLFSYQNWVLTSEQPLNTLVYSKYQQSIFCKTKAQWRWLKKQPKTVVETCFQNMNQWSLLTEVQIPQKMPVCIIIFIIHYFLLISDCIDRARQRRLLSLFIQYIYQYWKENGFVQLKKHFEELALSFQDLSDYMQREGYRLGIPPSWQHIVTRSELWHQRILEEQRQAEDEAHQALRSQTWASPIDHLVIKDVEFVALNTGKMLFDEGQRMHHCIFTYTKRCKAGDYLAFSVRFFDKQSNEQEYQYATLGLFRSIYGNEWEVDQFRHPHNKPVEIPFVWEATKVFCSKLNKNT